MLGLAAQPGDGLALLRTQRGLEWVVGPRAAGFANETDALGHSASWTSRTFPREGGAVVLLATDGVEGLMVRNRAGTWINAPTIPGTLICNIGDCLMRWTNDVYVSTPHRVVSPGGVDRLSIAFFLDPNPDAVVECLPGCMGPDRPPRYPAITGADYLGARLDATYVHRRM